MMGVEYTPLPGNAGTAAARPLGTVGTWLDSNWTSKNWSWSTGVSSEFSPIH